VTPVDPDRFDDIVREALDSLPDWVLDSMENVQVTVEDVPPAGQPGLLGLYQGIPLTGRGFAYAGALPDKITLYRSSLVAISRSDSQLRANIAHTVAHEIAHHFGISDDRLKEIDRY
jgi:predicted Zn-dependent protease with MMP-like domain